MRVNARTAIHVVALALIAASLSGCSYNKFTTQEEAIKAQWAQVQNQLQRRNDLIPNLVETVKGYATHEESVYKDIAESRSRPLKAYPPKKKSVKKAIPKSGPRPLPPRPPKETSKARNRRPRRLGRPS